MKSPRRRAVIGYGAAAGLSLLLPGCGPQAQEAPTQAPFSDGALRLVFRHSVREGRETFSVENMRSEPVWGGRTDALARAPEWGDYRLSLSAPDGSLIFRSGFDSSISPSARAATTLLTTRVPMPSRPVSAAIAKRRAEQTFVEMLNVEIDPQSEVIERSATPRDAEVHALVAHGPPRTKVDLLVLGDGYSAREASKFIADARAAVEHLFSVKPFSARVADFNVQAVFAPSAESGVTDPYLEVRRNTVLGCSYGMGEAERTLSVGNAVALAELGSMVPHDFVLVLANARRYGGSAYFAGPAVVAIDSASARYLVLHELAHSFAGLADEYYVASAAGPEYRSNVEPWQPNVTRSAATTKWSGPSGTPPVPQSWNKAEYDRRFSAYVERYLELRAKRADEKRIEMLMAEERQRQRSLLEKSGAVGRIGLFEGASGYARGLFRCEVDCIMFSLQTDYFCAACSSAIERMIDHHCCA